MKVKQDKVLGKVKVAVVRQGGRNLACRHVNLTASYSVQSLLKRMHSTLALRPALEMIKRARQCSAKEACSASGLST